jgi:hypothetical protein
MPRLSYLLILGMLATISINMGCSKTTGSNPPQLNSFYPLSEGPGLPVLIKGLHFGTDATKVQVLFNGTVADISQISDTLIAVTVPKGASSGKLTVTISGKPISSSTDFTVLSGSWDRGGDDLPVARFSAASFAINGKGYIMGGSDFAGIYKDFYTFDPGTGHWTQLPDFPGLARMGMISFVLNNNAYICGGQGYHNKLFPELWQYDPLTGNWQQKSTYPGGGASDFFHFSINGKEYVGGGYNLDSVNIGTIYLDCWEYDPVMDAWARKADFIAPNKIPSCSISTGTFGFTGLFTEAGGSLSTDWYEFDPVANTWAARLPMPPQPNNDPPTVAGGALGLTSAGLGYVMGGNYRTCWEYNATNYQWTQKTSMLQARGAAGGFVINNICYLVGGNSNNHAFADCYKFIP